MSHTFEEYDYYKELDPHAKQSSAMKKSFFQHIKQDGDIWLETVFRNRKTDKKRIYFVSQKTGIRSRDEPPTGASSVVYLKNSARKLRMSMWY